MKKLQVLMLSLCLSVCIAHADDYEVDMPVGEVLGLELPGLADLGDSAKADEIRRAMVMHQTRNGLPEAGSEFAVFGMQEEWTVADPTGHSGESPGIWLVYADAHRYTQGRIKAEGLGEMTLWKDGVEVSGSDGSFDLELASGTYLLALFHGGAEPDEDVAISWEGKSEHDAPEFHVAPRRRVSARLLTNADKVGSMAISPDGRYLALARDRRDDTSDSDLERLEIRDLNAGRIVHQWTASRPHSLAWSPDGEWLAWRQGNHLWLKDWQSGESRLLLANHEDLGSYQWHPDSASLVFAWTEPFEDDNSKTRRLRALEDRWDTFRDEAQIYQVDVASGLIRPLTGKDASVTLRDIHPDGDRILASRRLIDYEEPPHSLFRLFEVDLESRESRTIGEYRLLNAALFADEGYWLLAGPGLSQGDGSTVSGDRVPNEYDTQLYRLSDDGETARSASREFDPAIGGLHRLESGELLMPVVEGERSLLYRFEPGDDRFTRLETGLDVLEEYVASRQDRPVVALRGSDVDAPQRVHTLDVERNRHTVVLDSRESEYPQVELGEVRDWSFTNEAGVEIEGRYYLPPDFDEGRQYPAIVYYYGGTTPVNRQFTGRYPFHLWAAKGYVVYILQPRGTIGYGQELSALHVNAWGEYAADDIIEGAEKFARDHDFVDGDRMGNIGASYGGFMTMYVATRTDLFAASVSHAGISALTSYWGQGWWGYGYSGIASRDSFPWNNPELYVGQSPVYSADQITTPLLLLTGDSDTNVPPGESHNMFTALKLLGRDVELIEVPGEDHWILDREKRYAWWDAMLAWFDYWLKDETEWWEKLYPE